MNLLIAGDTVPKDNNNNLFKQAEIEKILGKELKEIWIKANYRVFNLEAPITSWNKKIKKCGPNLKIEPETINGIKAINPTLVLLANNHIMDYGYQGLSNTLEILEENNLKYIGAEKNLKEIKKSYILKTDKKKIAIYNCCDNEFSIATEDIPGANGCDLLNIWEEIEKLKIENDYVIIVYHGGKEHYRYPSPNLQKLCRKMIDYGADLIICQHSHCIGCYEIYKEKTIVYGQGNFIFDGDNNEYWTNSLILDINIQDNFKINYIPICKTKYGTRIANDEEKEKILREFENRSQKIIKESFIKEKYEQFSVSYFQSYLQTCHGDNLLYRILNKLLSHKLTEKLYSVKSLLALLNIIECDAHRELFIEGLKNKVNIKEEGKKE